ncbi:MAG: phosphotransferase [Actinomycetes bacterium]
MPFEPEMLDGNMGGVERRGDAVHRAVGPWTPAVHTLLTHLSDRLPAVPQVLGFDAQGREVLSYLPGDVVDTDHQLLTDRQLWHLVEWTRQFHVAVEDFDHAGPWRYFEVPNPTLIGHNDIAPYNACFNGDELTGIFDWDLAGPTNPLAELAFIAWNCVPLTRDLGSAEAARRLALISDSYGLHSAPEILDAVPARIRVMLEGIPARAASGDVGMQRLVALGEPERSQRTLDALVGRIPDIARCL